MKQLQIRDKLYLIGCPVDRPASGQARMSKKQIDANNHIWIFDRSGSMSWTVNELVDDMIAKLDTLDIGDTLSVGWFSGEGQRDFILKGARISGVDGNKKIAAILRKYANTVGCTCFSEILNQTDTVIEDLAALNPVFSLVFFTDGCPVVQNYLAELAAINAAIEKIKGKLTSVLLVGYGAYYNKELMADMAARLSGTLVHSANLAEYSNSLTEFLVDAKENGGRVPVAVSKHAKDHGLHGLFFSMNNKTVVAYQPDSSGSFNFVTPRTGLSEYYYLAKAPIANGAETLSVETPSGQRAAYAAALVMTQRTKTDVALEVLGAVGDVALIDAITNSFTNDEYGRTEAKIRAAIAGPKGRFVKGHNDAYLPKRDAFCVVDLVDILQADETTRFLPLDPGFAYNRIGVKTTAKDEVKVKFVPEANPAISIETLTWNNEMLNLSLTGKIPGTVELDDNAAKYGFAKNYPTYIWRSYSIIKDGNVNVTTLPLIVSKATFTRLAAEGVVDGGWFENSVTTVHLDRIPVMNRAIADGRTSATDLVKDAIVALRTEYRVKALKVLRDTLDTGKPVRTVTALTPAQIAYLETFHIGRNGFQPPSKTEPPTDKYVAKEFTVKLKGFSTPPKPIDVATKVAAKKKLTPSETLMQEAMAASQKLSKSRALVEGQLTTETDELRRIRRSMQRTKFAVLLGKRWFDEFSSRDAATIDVNGFTATFSLREVEVPI